MKIEYPILAVETSGEACSVAVLLKKNEFALNTIRKKHVHSEKLLLMVDEVLRSVNLRLGDMNHIAVSNGPGSFTGLRIGMSAVKGLAAGAELPVVQVPTFDALAMQITLFLPGNSEFIVANNVNITELYYGRYKKSGDYYDVVEPVRLIKKEDFETLTAPGIPVFGNYYRQSTGFGISFPSAEYLAKWSYIFGKDLLTYDIDYIEPDYLKKFIAKEQIK